MSFNNSSTHCQTLALKSSNHNVQAELCFTFATLPELQKQVQELLHVEEIEYWHTLKFDKRKASYLLGKYAAKQAIKHFDGKISFSDILIKPGIFEYPVVYHQNNNKIQVTLSHCESTCSALAFLETHPMGIDLEDIKKSHEPTIDTVLTNNERLLINTLICTTDAPYIIFWTIKEALSKALRTGMMTPFAIYEIKNIIYRDNYWLSEFENFAQYQAISFILYKQVCSIVYPRGVQLDINIPLIQEWGLKLYQS